MTKYIMLLTPLFLLLACGGDDGNDPVDDNAQSDADTTPVWVTYAGIEWSPLRTRRVTWESAKNYCGAMGARLPTINELRKIIINCPQTEYGGVCKASDPDCLRWDCWSEGCDCDGSADSYSALGDIHRLWSSSSRVEIYAAWFVDFSDGKVSYYNKSGEQNTRCVR
ncbi:MAG TPA: DUF1566 domain-containing protein [bacterium]|nr:DUF1566 domain-containing protein [bacterium]